jgi:hypothetical protein
MPFSYMEAGVSPERQSLLVHDSRAITISRHSGNKPENRPCPREALNESNSRG